MRFVTKPVDTEKGVFHDAINVALKKGYIADATCVVITSRSARRRRRNDEYAADPHRGEQDLIFLIPGIMFLVIF